MSENKKIAIVRVRGSVDMNMDIEKTLKILRLYKKNYCVVLEGTPSILGMIKKVKDYVTFGEIDEENYKLLIEKRGDDYKGRESDNKSGKFIVFNNKKYKPFFRLQPPKKGFGRKGTKVGFKIGGALGDRKEKIIDLIKRMI